MAVPVCPGKGQRKGGLGTQTWKGQRRRGRDAGVPPRIWGSPGSEGPKHPVRTMTSCLVPARGAGGGEGSWSRCPSPEENLPGAQAPRMWWVWDTGHQRDLAPLGRTGEQGSPRARPLLH